MAFLPTPIKSAQSFDAIFLGGALSANAIIASVDPTYSILIPLGWTAWDASGFINASFFQSAKILNATTVRANTTSATSADTHFRGTILEFYPQVVKSSGYAELAMANTADSNTQAIAVNAAKTMLVPTGLRTTLAGGILFDGSHYTPAGIMSQVELTSNTVVTAYWVHDSNFALTNNRIVAYNWIEFR